MAKTLPIKEIIYKDLDISFIAHPNTKNVKVLTNEQAIVRAFKNLVFTNRYEKLYDPNFYTDTRKTLFENITPGTAITLKRRIEAAAKVYSPRVKIVDVYVKDEPDYNRIAISIFFLMVNKREPEEIKFFLERVR